MELTRRDATAALAAIGATGAVAYGAARSRREREGGSDPDTGPPVDEEQIRETLSAAAVVLYPREISGIDGFVDAFLDGRLDRPEHANAIGEGVTELDERAIAWYGDRFVKLSTANRDSLLREIGADTADEDPDGTTAERIRYYVVNELLLALYASPTGGKLVGIENPQGYPGGIESYRRGPR
ncbi:MAG: gluconate 2-dehydrogenase subunit 3 family protein [Halobacteriota archaeon]|uniref:gluconate 2-dehydrogenase subunit 3 family protein n=1 Tax=Natronomonas sp. TaxID=2184060 RepID=UPI0039771DE9